MMDKLKDQFALELKKQQEMMEPLKKQIEDLTQQLAAMTSEMTRYKNLGETNMALMMKVLQRLELDWESVLSGKYENRIK